MPIDSFICSNVGTSRKSTGKASPSVLRVFLYICQWHKWLRLYYFGHDRAKTLQIKHMLSSCFTSKRHYFLASRNGVMRNDEPPDNGLYFVATIVNPMMRSGTQQLLRLFQCSTLESIKSTISSTSKLLLSSTSKTAEEKYAGTCCSFPTSPLVNTACVLGSTYMRTAGGITTAVVCKKGNMIHGFKIDGLKCGCAVNGEYLRLFSQFLTTPRTSTAFRARYSPKDSLLEFVGRSTSVTISNAVRRVRDLCWRFMNARHNCPSSKLPFCKTPFARQALPTILTLTTQLSDC